jgi:hypothetical protein
LPEVVTKAVQAAGTVRVIATTTKEAGRAAGGSEFRNQWADRGDQRAAVAGPEDCPFEFVEGSSSPQLSGLVSSLVAALISSALTFIG